MNVIESALPLPSLIRSCAGDNTADDELHVLLQRYERPLYGYLLARLKDEDCALDCVQDTFLRAYQSLQRGRPVNKQWLYTVARNRAMDEFRRKRHFDPDTEALDHIASTDDTDRRMFLHDVLAKLAPMDRDVLYLYAVAGFKTDEIGDIMGVRGAAIRQRLYRARERARHLFGDAA